MLSLLDGFAVESPAYAAIRFLVYLGVTVLLGALCTRHVVVPRLIRAIETDATFADAIEHRLQHWIRWALVLLYVGTGLRLAAQYVSFFGPVSWSLNSMYPLLLQTIWGYGWLVAVGSLLCASFGQEKERRSSSIGRVLVVLGTLGFVWSMAMSGHPAAADWPYLAMTLDVLHVLGAGAWLGTLLMLMVVAIPLAVNRTPGLYGEERVARLVAIFSPIAMLCAPVVVATGVIAGWRELGGVLPLFTTDYGVRLLWKLGGVTIVGLLGAYNWRNITPVLGEAAGTKRLRKSAAAELVMAGIVLAVTSVLVATSPP